MAIAWPASARAQTRADTAATDSLRAREARLEQVTITSSTARRMEAASVGRVVLDRPALHARPHVGDDLYRALARLPGVTSTDISAGFHVRGAEIDQLYATLDGHQLREPFHLKDVGGAVSLLDAQSVDSIALSSGGFGAQYGGRLGAVLEMSSRSPRADHGTWMVGAGITGVRGQADGRFGTARQGSWLAAARVSYLRTALRLGGGPADSISPGFTDVFLRADYRFGARHAVGARLLRADDALRVRYEDVAITSRYGSTYLWLTGDSWLRAALHVRTVLSLDAFDSQRRGSPTLRATAASAIRDDRHFHGVGLRQDWTFRAHDMVTLRWGADAERAQASYDYVFRRNAQAVRNGVIVNELQQRLVSLAPDGTQFGMYLSPRFQLTRWLTAEPGVRYGNTSWSRDASASPRIDVRADAGARTSLRLAGGRYTQPPQLFELQVQDSVTRFADADVATHAVFGIDHRLSHDIVLRAEAYERRMPRLASRYINLGRDVDLFPEVAADRVRLDPASGLARGIELVARRAPATGLDLSASYTSSSITDVVRGVRIPRTHDQTHAILLDASVHPRGAAWRLSAGALVRSGWPSAPVTFTVDSALDARGRRVAVVSRTYGPLTELGARRLPWYRRYDVRYTHDIETSRGRVGLFGDVFNVLGSANSRGYSYRGVVSNGALVVTREPLETIGRLISAGVTFERR